MKHLAKLILSAALFAAQPVWAATVDNFESYGDGAVVGNYDLTKPWTEFGGVTDPLTATSWPTANLAGSQTGVIGVAVGGSSSGFITVRKVLGGATDYSSLGDSNVASVLLKSLFADPSGLQVRLSISGGDGTQYQSAVAQLVPTTPNASLQPLIFSLKASDFELADGDQTIDTVLSSVTQIGFNFTLAPNAAPANETLAIDNFEINAVPEPASLALVGGGLMAMSMRRRRR